MNTHVQHAITGRLSLRAPQSEALARLARALQAAPEMLQKERQLTDILTVLKTEFNTLEDFEREFPSLCFALATGVGKTRLMGAFVAYLHLAYGIHNFFVLAPNLTVYNKLITDFTPNTPKYVFKGISAFAEHAPLIITGDNYDQRGAVMETPKDGFLDDVRINIFNISKINSEVRGGKEPRIKRMREVLGDSYFNHLASLPDLVLLMDESHRYRAQAGMRAINELQPLLGLELTATPFVESARGPVPFKNVVMDYPLARAMEDGFVKDPAVVTQRHFSAANHTPEEIETIKLQDGVRIHEITKVELQTYARDNGLPPVKPFMLIIARDTTHASELLARMESEHFFEGRYKGKVIQVDSSRTGAEEEEMINRLLAVESVDEPTEIVIHVNMLKEGWDVTNLYTIVPLRAANARTLVEQSIGRGLRLPYGKRTGVPEVDQLNIIAHDKFQEIIDEANRGDSPIRLKQRILEAPSTENEKCSVQVAPSVEALLGLNQTAGAGLPAVAAEMHTPDTGAKGVPNTAIASISPAPVFTTEAQKQAARVVMEVIGKYETQHERVPTRDALLRPEVQQEIVAEVAARLKPVQADWLAQSGTKPDSPSEAAPDMEADAKGSDPALGTALDLHNVVAATTAMVVQHNIDIPRIVVVPSEDVTTGFYPFKLDVSQLNLQPGQEEMVSQNLRTNQQRTFSMVYAGKAKRPEDNIIFKLIDCEDIDYFTQSELLYDLAGQAVQHFLSYLSPEEAHQVVRSHCGLIANEIRAQMMAHFWEKASSYSVKVSRGFTALKPCNYTVSPTQGVHHFRETVLELSRIKQMLFGGFSRCLYPLQKFDSDTERRFAIMADRDAVKWFKPAKGQFQIDYAAGTQRPEYIPDFVLETASAIWMVETKARTDIHTPEVQAKAEAAVCWCQYASDYAHSVGGKPWKYLLVPHDEIKESMQLSDFLRFEVKAPNATTKKAIAELEKGKGKKFSSVDDLMTDLRSDD